MSAPAGVMWADTGRPRGRRDSCTPLHDVRRASAAGSAMTATGGPVTARTTTTTTAVTVSDGSAVAHPRRPATTERDGLAAPAGSAAQAEALLRHPSTPAPQHAEVDAVLGADTCSDRHAYPRTRWRLFAAKQGRVIADAAASVTTSVTASAVGDEGSGPATRNRESQQAFTSRRSVGPGRPTAS